GGVGIELVSNVEIVQRRLQDKRGWVVQYIICNESSCQEQFMNLSPWSAVSNRHCGVEDHALLFSLGAVVDHYPTQHRAVGNGDHLSFLCVDMRHQQCLLHYLSYVVPHPHEISHLKCPHIGQNSSRNPMCNRRRGTE